MNADLLAMLGGAGLGGGLNTRVREAVQEGKTILSFKAGKMIATLQENGKYLLKADPRRGLINLIWNSNSSSNTSSSLAAATAGTLGGMLKLEWKDRRTQAVVDSLPIFPEDNCTYSKVDTGREKDRVYLLQYGNASQRRFFFWIQECEAEKEQDEENCVKINMFMSDPTEAAIAAGVTRNVNVTSTATRTTGTVPVGTSSLSSSSAASAAVPTGTSGANRLTLDLSAFAGLGTSNPIMNREDDAILRFMQGFQAARTESNDSTENIIPSVTDRNPSTDASIMPPPSSTATSTSGPIAMTPSAPSTDQSSRLEEPILTQSTDASIAPVSTTTTTTTAAATSGLDVHPAVNPNLMALTPTTISHTTTTAKRSVSGVGNSILTLADLQGAMAGLATMTPPSSSSMTSESLVQGNTFAPATTADTNNVNNQNSQKHTFRLQDLINVENVLESGILQDDNVKRRLLELLPEGQQTEEQLIENLRTPQIRQCLKALSAALCNQHYDSENEDYEEDVVESGDVNHPSNMMAMMRMMAGGSRNIMSSSWNDFSAIVTNFQLRPEDGIESFQSTGNPIQAFLDCILKSVERESNHEETKDITDNTNHAEDANKKKDGTDGNLGGTNEDTEMRE